MADSARSRRDDQPVEGESEASGASLRNDTTSLPTNLDKDTILGGVGPSKNTHQNITAQRVQYKMSSETTERIPRFLLIKMIDGDFSKVSPFLISKSLYGLIGETLSVKKVKEHILVQCTSNAQAKRLLQITRFSNFDVIVEPHPTLNTSKGVIYCRDFLNCSLEEIEEGLKDTGVIKVTRIKTKKGEELVDTPNHILTFNTPIMPLTIKAAYYNLKIRQYIPNPMRCFKCQKFGHTATRCQSEEEICICGRAPHSGAPCEIPLKCVNCDGDHSARSRQCPKYKLEMAIQKVKIAEKISYSEAKKKVVIQTPVAGMTYAQATKNSNVEQIVAMLIPHISEIIKDTLYKTTEMNVGINTSNIPSTSRNRLTTEFTKPDPPNKEKRKRSDQLSDTGDTDADRASDTSEFYTETFEGSTKRTLKKKRGWPKGKSRL